ncbi:MAG TPA: hypothetical protein VFE78_39700 [Gemmataceae bacterium]|jgi:hypothetical protein|nr:hypothetical protein [Gemmataceae bacterium]
MRSFFTLAAFLAAVGPLCAAPAPAREDYQKKADEAPWAWSDERASAADSAKRMAGDYKAEVEARGMFGRVAIRLVKDGAVVHSFDGHTRTVFAVRDHVLYYADFGPSSSGCEVVAFDLRAKKQLWKAQLKGLGPIAHTRYSNAVNLDLEKFAVRVRGKESAGRYVEYVDLKTGKTVGHKKY